ncbi:MAG: orotidine-5'-phosphate decarboxylase [Actinomycetota bacterium]
MKPRPSNSKIDPRERLIFALDFSTAADAHRMVRLLGDSVQFFKIGWELLMSGGAFTLGEQLHKDGKKVMLDLKFFDVPETVGAAVRNIKAWADFATVQGYPSLIAAAAANKRESVAILAVTVLTSLDRADIEDLGFKCSVEELVVHRTKLSLGSGADGVIASGLEVPKLRQAVADEAFLIVTPGIRPEEQQSKDDQKRVVGAERAFLSGADYIVVGRPIKNADDPRAAALNIQGTITKVFS